MSEIYEPGTRIISREQCAKITAFSFIIIGLFLHIKYGNLFDFWTLKGLAYFVIGMFIASLTIGVLMYNGNRFLETKLFSRHPNMRGIGSTLFFALLLVFLYKGSVKVYFWLYSTQTKVSWEAADYQSAEHFQIAKQSSVKFWYIIGGTDQPEASLSNVKPNQLQSLVDTAISESSLVKESYLVKVHPKLPEMYAKLFVPSLHNVSEFFRTQNEQEMINALQSYGRYVDWMNSHYKDFNLIK